MEWRYVFFVCAGFDLFGAIVFGLFASGTIQDWARDEVEIEVKIPKEVEVNSEKKMEMIHAENEKKLEKGQQNEVFVEPEITYSTVVKRHVDSDHSDEVVKMVQF